MRILVSVMTAVFLAGAAIMVIRTSTRASSGTYSILGDSYSAYAGYIPEGNNSSYPISGNDVDDVSQMWWRKFSDRADMSLELNESYSGSPVCNDCWGRDYSYRSFVTRMVNLPESDIIFVFGGTNDAEGKSALGDYKYSGWTDDDLDQFRPAYAYMLDWLRENRPRSEIVCIINDLGASYAEYTASMETIAGHYGVRAIKLFDISKVKGHPDRTGMAEIGAQVTDALMPEDSASDYLPSGQAIVAK